MTPNKAYHLIQAFAPGEVSFEEAHTIGQELADKVLERKYSYVVTTHIDKGHVHNHIIFCAADNINHDKYHDCDKTYYRIRHLSDELCKEHNLSIISPAGQRGKKYNKWQADKRGSSSKTQLRKDINIAIKSSSTYDEFLLLMRAKGYEIKGETFGEDARKYISFRPPGQNNFVSGSARSLGKEYTKERIKERIEQKRERKIAIPKKDYASRKLVDTSEEKYENSLALKRLATIENLKITAASYNEAGFIAELERKISVQTQAGKSAKQSVVELKHRIKDLGEIIKYAQQYRSNRSYHIGYKKAKNPDAYFRRYESQIILYGGAKRMLTFIDESGYPRPTDSTQNPILLGVCIHENDIKPITNQIYKLKDSIYGKQDEIKSTKLIREATITKNRTNNKAYVEIMVDIISSYDAAIFAVIMDKPDEPIIVPEHHLPKQYYLLLKKVEFYCNHHHYGKAMMIFDEVHEDADRKIAEAITGFLFKTKFGRSFHHILEMPLFVSSAVTPAVQFADIFAGIVRHYYENELDQKEPETEFQKWIAELFSKLHNLTENNYIPKSHYIEYGFQKIGKNFSYPVNEKFVTSEEDATVENDISE